MAEQAAALAPVVDRETWKAALDDLRVREKAVTRHTDGCGTVQLSRTFALVDVLPWGRQGSPRGRPTPPTCVNRFDSPDVARLSGPSS